MRNNFHIFALLCCSVSLSTPAACGSFPWRRHTRTRLDPQMHVCVQRRWAAASPWSGKTGRCRRRETSWEGNPGVAVHVLGASLPWEQLTQGAENNGGRHISQLALGQLRLWALVKLHLDGSQTRTIMGFYLAKEKRKEEVYIWYGLFSKRSDRWWWPDYCRHGNRRWWDGSTRQRLRLGKHGQCERVVE